MQLVSLLQGITHTKNVMNLIFEHDATKFELIQKVKLMISTNVYIFYRLPLFFFFFGVESVTQRGKNPANAISAHCFSAYWRIEKPFLTTIHINIFDTLNSFKLFILLQNISCFTYSFNVLKEMQSQWKS